MCHMAATQSSCPVSVHWVSQGLVGEMGTENHQELLIRPGSTEPDRVKLLHWKADGKQWESTRATLMSLWTR